MNQILGPDKSAPLWYGCSSKKGGKTREPEPMVTVEDVTEAAGGLTVKVGGFGDLATLTDKTDVTLKFPKAAKLGDVVEAMGQVCGAQVQTAIEGEAGGLAKCCRIFVDGEILDDVDASLSPSGEQAEMQIIILMANEAG